MSPSINWLHLTDLHVGMGGQDWLWPQMRLKLRDDLKEMHEKCGPWQLVLFSGDLVYSGGSRGPEFQELDEILNELWDWFKELGCEPKLLCVPGNHDLKWQDADSAAVHRLENWGDDSKLREIFWSDENEYRAAAADAFAAYSEWWSNTPLRPGNVQQGLLPGDFSYSFEHDDLRLGIVGLNSSFLQLTGKSDYVGRLALHPKQLQAVCSGDAGRWAEMHHACILMTHHPPGWLDEESRLNLSGEILDQKFCLHLCGHTHETHAEQKQTGMANDAPQQWLGRSLFGLEWFGDDRIGRSHGYAAGKLTKKRKSNSGSIQFFPRRREQQGEAWSIVPDTSVKLNKTTNDRTRAVSIKLNAVVRSAEPMAEVPPATDFSVNDAREVFGRVIASVDQVLQENVDLHNELKLALKSTDPGVRNDAQDIVDVIFADGLFEVLKRLVDWMSRSHDGRFDEQLMQLVQAFSALGVPLERVKPLQQKLESRRVDIAASSNPPIAAMVAGALLDVPIEWIESKDDIDPIPKQYASLSADDVPYAADTKDGILKELKKRLMSLPMLRIDVESLGEKQALKDLRERLKGLDGLGKPLFTILRESELNIVDGDDNFDWRSLLIFRKTADVDESVPDAKAISTMVQGILEQLSGKSKLSRRRVDP